MPGHDKEHALSPPPTAVAYRFARRLKITNTILSAVNWSFSQAEFLSTTFKYYRYNVIPPWANAIFYIVPSMLPFLFSIKDWCNPKKDEHAPSTETTKLFLYWINQIPKMADALKDKITHEKFMDLVELIQYDGNNIKIDIVLNSLLSFLSALHGFFFLLQEMNLTTEETDDEIIDISGRIYTSLNNLYLLIVVIQKLIGEGEVANRAKKGFGKFGASFWKAYNALTHPAKHHDEEIDPDDIPKKTTPEENVLQANSIFKKALRKHEEQLTAGQADAIAIDIRENKNDLHESLLGTAPRTP